MVETLKDIWIKVRSQEAQAAKAKHKVSTSMTDEERAKLGAKEAS